MRFRQEEEEVEKNADVANLLFCIGNTVLDQRAVHLRSVSCLPQWSAPAFTGKPAKRCNGQLWNTQPTGETSATAHQPAIQLMPRSRAVYGPYKWVLFCLVKRISAQLCRCPLYTCKCNFFSFPHSLFFLKPIMHYNAHGTNSHRLMRYWIEKVNFSFKRAAFNFTKLLILKL